MFVDTMYATRASGSGLELNVIVSNPHVTTHPVEGCHAVSCRRSVRGGSWADTWYGDLSFFVVDLAMPRTLFYIF